MPMKPLYNTKLFNEIFPTAESFKESYDVFQATAGLLNLLDDTDIALTWQLITAKYGNTPISSWSEDQFKLKCWQTMFQYGPTWVKKLDIQHTLRNLSYDDIMTGATAIYNTALNPDTVPSTQSTNELPYINEQHVSKRLKNIVQAYGELEMLLDTDVTEQYLSKFKKLFMYIVDPTCTYIYETEDEGDE